LKAPRPPGQRSSCSTYISSVCRCTALIARLTPPAVVGRLIETCHEADGMLWSSPALHRQGECDDAAERVVEGSGFSD
jgi:hypothetical protein